MTGLWSFPNSLSLMCEDVEQMGRRGDMAAPGEIISRSLYTAQCTLYTVHCTLYTVQCSGLCTVSSLKSTVQVRMYTVQCHLRVKSTKCTGCIVECVSPSPLSGGDSYPSFWEQQLEEHCWLGMKK